jgi:hypothetical protein
MPVKELQGLPSASGTFPIEQQLPGSGQLVIDHLINVALLGQYEIHQHFLGFARLHEPQIRRLPRVSPYIWATSCIVVCHFSEQSSCLTGWQVEEHARRELNDLHPFHYYKEKHRCLVQIFVDTMVMRREEYLSLEHALLMHASNLRMWADMGSTGYPSS